MRDRVRNVVNTDVPVEQTYRENKPKNFFTIVHAILNYNKSYGFSRPKKASFSNFRGATCEKVLEETEDTLKNEPDTLIFHEETSKSNTFRNVLKNVKRQKEPYQDAKIEFLNITYQKKIGKRNIDK